MKFIRKQWIAQQLKCESPTTRRVGGLDFSAIGGKKPRHGSLWNNQQQKEFNNWNLIVISNGYDSVYAQV